MLEAEVRRVQALMVEQGYTTTVEGTLPFVVRGVKLPYTWEAVVAPETLTASEGLLLALGAAVTRRHHSRATTRVTLVVPDTPAYRFAVRKLSDSLWKDLGWLDLRYSSALLGNAPAASETSRSDLRREGDWSHRLAAVLRESYRWTGNSKSLRAQCAQVAQAKGFSPFFSDTALALVHLAQVLYNSSPNQFAARAGEVAQLIDELSDLDKARRKELWAATVVNWARIVPTWTTETVHTRITGAASFLSKEKQSRITPKAATRARAGGRSSGISISASQLPPAAGQGKRKLVAREIEKPKKTARSIVSNDYDTLETPGLGTLYSVLDRRRRPR